MQGPSRVSRIEIYDNKMRESIALDVAEDANQLEIANQHWYWVLGHEIGHGLTLTHVHYNSIMKETAELSVSPETGNKELYYRDYPLDHDLTYQLVPTDIINNYDNVVEASQPMPDFAAFPNNGLQGTNNPNSNPNNQDNGDGTETDTGTTNPPPPPTDLLVSAGDGQVSLSWTAPSDTSITNYEYRYRQSGTLTWGDWTSTGSTKLYSRKPEHIND